MQVEFTPPQSWVRRSNIELYRIIVIFMIVVHHFVVNSGVLDIMYLHPTATRSLVLYLIGMWGKTGINCFVMITGWFMCKSHITAHKFFKLLLWIMFYDFFIALIFKLTGYADYGFREFIAACLPVKSIKDGFTSCYLVFFLFIPFLNILIQNMNRRQHLLIVLLSLASYTVLPTLHMELTFNYVTWFCILYFIASYLRLYPVLKEESLRFWSITTIGLMLLAMASVLFMIYFNVYRGHSTDIVSVYQLVTDSNKLLAVMIAISSFLAFKNINMRHSHIINTIAASTFGVLLIHANSDWMRQWLWKDVCDVSGHYFSPYFYLYIIIVPIVVFTVCIFMDHLRLKFMEPPVLKAIDKWYEKGKEKVKVNNI